MAARSSEEGRIRKAKPRRNIRLPNVAFINPYPHMSAPEAMVHLELERRRVPFSWRYFDGESVLLKTLLPDFTPEFTLREHKLVILIIGEFWGLLPSVIDVNALAQALLEEDGWKVVTLHEAEVRQDVRSLVSQRIPELDRPVAFGLPRPNPYGVPDFMSKRRQHLRGFALARAKFDPEKGTIRGRNGRRRIRRRYRLDTGRRRFT